MRRVKIIRRTTYRGIFLMLSEIELIFVNGTSEIRWHAGHIIYAEWRFYDAQYNSGLRLLSVASNHYVYWASDMDITAASDRLELIR